MLRIGPPVGDPDVLPLPLIARYLNCYGIRADKIRITNRVNASDASRRETWIGFTVSAADNLAALQARSSRIPLHETTQVAARRLADHLREIGWEASAAGPDDVPRLLEPASRETWRGVQQGGSDCLAAYRVSADDALSDTLDAIRSHPARETWTALEIAGPTGIRRPPYGRGRMRLGDRCAARGRGAAARHDPAARKPLARANGIGSVVHPTTRRARRGARRIADAAALADSATGAHRAPLTEAART